jgi:hypothetical protein
MTILAASAGAAVNAMAATQKLEKARMNTPVLRC